MTLQDKKNYLARFTSLKRRMFRTQEEIKQNRSTADSITKTLSFTPKTKTDSDRIQSAVEKMAELEERLIADFERFTEERQKIMIAIENVPNENYLELLTMRYIDGKTFEYISCALDYSWRHVHRVHSKALLAIKI